MACCSDKFVQFTYYLKITIPFLNQTKQHLFSGVSGALSTFSQFANLCLVLKASFCFYIGKPSNHLKTYNGLSDVSLKKYLY